MSLLPLHLILSPLQCRDLHTGLQSETLNCDSFWNVHSSHDEKSVKAGSSSLEPEVILEATREVRDT